MASNPDCAGCLRASPTGKTVYQRRVGCNVLLRCPVSRPGNGLRTFLGCGVDQGKRNYRGLEPDGQCVPAMQL